MSLFLMWLGVMFPLVFSPGPANVVFAASGARVGLKRSIPLVAGVDVIFIIKSIVIGFGLGEIVKTHTDIMNTMQLLGSLYLLYLAFKFATSSGQQDGKAMTSLGFLDGLLIQILNSKGWLMVFLMFSLFSESSLQVFGEYGIVILIVWLAVLNITTHILWVSIGEALARVSSSLVYEKALNFFYAGSLAMVSVWLILDNPMLNSLVVRGS
ncbi:LysE family translocator [Vibrio sp. T187]|uniref:LysE family translocator n=1 Tax=Vibrio TaxID=662 RepID=UPI0010CA162F|nr:MULTISPECIES: LysE family transporter [Vibrio]MBW3695175.1 LysE family translocator [Vibrio sp. T187]